jgi:hypothetical protein
MVLARAVSTSLSATCLPGRLADLARGRSLGAPVFDGLFQLFLALKRALDHPIDRIRCGSRGALAHALEGDQIS